MLTTIALHATAASAQRAYRALHAIADAIEAMPPRKRRRLASEASPEVIRNEAERVMDTLSVYGLATRTRDADGRPL